MTPWTLKATQERNLCLQSTPKYILYSSPDYTRYAETVGTLSRRSKKTNKLRDCERYNSFKHNVRNPFW